MINNVAYLLEETVRNYPNKIGFSDIENQMTFSDFAITAKKIATSLINGFEWKKPIVVMMEKNVQQLTVFLGIAYSGNFYVPIDTKMPEERIKLILGILDTELVITDNLSFEKVSAILKNDSIKVLTYGDITSCSVNEEAIYKRMENTISISPLYVLFTSGSTGVPKGVVITHGSVCDYIDWLTETFCFNAETIFANQAPFYFDNSILDIYTTIKVGATMHIIPETYFMFPAKLIDYLNENKINTIFWVPSAISVLANIDSMKEKKPEYIKKVLFCGEVMPNKQLNYWRRKLPNVMYANLYGPTEITDVCTYYIVDREFQDDEPLPIGKACKNTEVLILNEKNKESAVNEIGELCVRGLCLAKGYYGDMEKTNEAFVQNPLNNKWNDYIYRTGDLVKMNDLNEIIYICRKDFQIKHMGHRIELGEIETATYAFEKVEQCCALYNDKEQKIILVCSVNAGDITEKEIYKGLQKKLPKYMLPSVIIIKEKLSLNGNGKIDRSLLKQKMEAEKW